MRRWRHRPVQAVAVVALAALLVASVAVAPLYYRAMQQSAAHVVLDRATVAARGVLLSQAPVESTFDPHPAQPPEQVAASVPPDLRDLLEPPVHALSSSAGITVTSSREPQGELLWREGQCDHVTFVDGGCPAGAAEIAVSAADAENFGLQPGDSVRATGPEGRTAPLRIVGVYEQQPADYWLGQRLTGRSGTISTFGLATTLLHDTWLTSRETIGAEGDPFPTRLSSAGFVLDPDEVDADDLHALGTGVDALARATPEPGVPPVTVTSALPSLDEDVQKQVDQARVTVPLLMAQLGLLAVVVLWLVLAAITEQRRTEVAVARLRGRGRSGARRLLLAELLPLGLVAVLPGAALAVLGVMVARSTVLPGDPPVEHRAGAG